MTSAVLDQTMKDAIRELLQQDHVSFAELARRIAGFRGEMAWGIQPKNLVLWHGISDEAARTLQQMLDDGEFHLHDARPLIYMLDGCCLKLPIARRPPRGGYKEPHWAPAVLKRGPMSECPHCRKKKQTRE
jgi:hypothetical protein